MNLFVQYWTYKVTLKGHFILAISFPHQTSLLPKKKKHACHRVWPCTWSPCSHSLSCFREGMLHIVSLPEKCITARRVLSGESLILKTPSYHHHFSKWWKHKRRKLGETLTSQFTFSATSKVDIFFIQEIPEYKIWNGCSWLRVNSNILLGMSTGKQEILSSVYHSPQKVQAKPENFQLKLPLKAIILMTPLCITFITSKCSALKLDMIHIHKLQDDE